MIIEEKNKYEAERKKIKRIFEMLKDIKLPKNYKFTEDCVEICYVSWFKYLKIAEIDLEGDVLEVCFVDEEELNRLREYFTDSKTKFKLVVGEDYY